MGAAGVSRMTKWSLGASAARRWEVAGALAVATALCGAIANAQVDATSVEQASDDRKASAQRAFLAGKGFWEEQRYEEALTAFDKSLEYVDSPNTRLMKSRTLMSMGRMTDAHWELGRVIDTATALSATMPQYRSAREAAQEERAQLEQSLGMVEVDVPGATPGTSLQVGEVSVPHDRWSQPIAVVPGAVRFAITGRPPVDVNVVAGQRTRVSIPLAAPVAAPLGPTNEDTEADDSGGGLFDDGTNQRILGLSVTGVGVAGFAVFGIFGALHLSKFDELETNCPDNQCSADQQSVADEGRTLQTVANVGVIVGAVGVAVGTAILVPTFIGDKDDNVALGVGLGSLQVQGSF